MAYTSDSQLGVREPLGVRGGTAGGTREKTIKKVNKKNAFLLMLGTTCICRTRH